MVDGISTTVERDLQSDEVTIGTMDLGPHPAFTNLLPRWWRPEGFVALHPHHADVVPERLSDLREVLTSFFALGQS